MCRNRVCGLNKLDWYVKIVANQDCSPDNVADLEGLPWPLPDNMADQIFMTHVLKKLYRICLKISRVIISVPYPRYDIFNID
jgi:hypothetical protein